MILPLITMVSSIKLVSTDNIDIPLKDIKVRMDICDQICQFTFEQSYTNTDTDVIEAHYVFPTMANTSVYDFEAKINDKAITTQLKTKEEAIKQYNKAISQGDKAFMMEQIDGDTFSVCLGNIPPNANVIIKIRCVTELKTEIDATQIRLNLPLTFMPKYKPANDASLLSTVMSSIINVFTKPYDYTFVGNITSSTNLISIDSKTHPVKLSNMKTNSIDFAITPTDLDTDIVLTIKRHTPKTSIIGERADNVPDQYKYAYQCNIIPDFSLVQESNVADMAYMIILDSSGSMSGVNFTNAVESAKLFVSLLPFGSKFNVFEFNSSYTKFRTNLTSCNLEEKMNAIDWLNKLKSTGGTEVFDVLKDAYDSLINMTGSIIFLSDGGVSNTEQVLKLVKKNKNIGMFTIGIGQNVSQQLIQEMANSSVGGTAEFINNTNDALNEKVNAQVKRAFQSMRKCQQNNKLAINTNGQYKMFPKMINLYEGDINTFHIFSSEVIQSITYTQSDNTGVSLSSVDLYPTLIDVGGNMIHRIAGVKLLNELKNNKQGSQISHLQQDPVKDDMINVSLALGILSKYTAFIGVEVNDTPNGTSFTPILKKIPLQMARNSTDDLFEIDETYLYGERNRGITLPVKKCATTIDNRVGTRMGSMMRNLISGNPSIRQDTNIGQNRLIRNNYFESRCDDSSNVDACLPQEADSEWFDICKTDYQKRDFHMHKVPDIHYGCNTLPKTVDELRSTNKSDLSYIKKIDFELYGNQQVQRESTVDPRLGMTELTYGSRPTANSKVVTKSKPVVWYIVKEKLHDYVNLSAHILTSKVNGELPFAKKVSIGDYIELTLEDTYNGIYKVISIGSINTPWTLEKF